jgi:hypothetical protein
LSHIIVTAIPLQIAYAFWTAWALRRTSSRRLIIKRSIEAYDDSQTQKPNMVEEVLDRPTDIQIIIDWKTYMTPEEAGRVNANSLQWCLRISTFCTPWGHDPICKRVASMRHSTTHA